jgi:hypothetical protein
LEKTVWPVVVLNRSGVSAGGPWSFLPEQFLQGGRRAVSLSFRVF